MIIQDSTATAQQYSVLACQESSHACLGDDEAVAMVRERVQADPELELLRAVRLSELLENSFRV